jgi:hypothetical protein
MTTKPMGGQAMPAIDNGSTKHGETQWTGHVLQGAMAMACRAPSLHNSQPWRWMSDGKALHLFADRTRMMFSADAAGRELLLSCGAALDHLVVAMAATGWDTAVERFPDPLDPDHLATVQLTAADAVTEAQRRRADAILRRRTDRLPFDEPSHWEQIETRLSLSVIAYHVMADVVLDSDRPKLAEASRLTETVREYDPSYQSELNWWTSPFASGEGVPPSALVSESEAARTDVARAFPATPHGDRRTGIATDHSKIFVLATHNEDARLDVLRCGEALSALLLEATLAGLATCTLTHMTELMASRDIIRRLTGQAGSPQLLVRVGVTPSDGRPSPATPRRPLAEVLELRP